MASSGIVTRECIWCRVEETLLSLKNSKNGIVRQVVRAREL